MVSARTPSSCSTTIGSPLRCGTDTVTISSANLPASIAAAARWFEAAASASCCSRRDLGLAGVALGAETHQARVERAPEAVGDDRVTQLGVAVAETAAGPVGEVRRVGHRLHAAGHDDVGVAHRHHLMREVDRVEARQADLVDVDRRDVHRDAGLAGSLASRYLTGAGHQHLAHDHVIDVLGSDAGPREGLGDRDAAEIGSRERCERTAHLADRGTSAGDDVRTLSHDTTVVAPYWSVTKVQAVAPRSTRRFDASVTSRSRLWSPVLPIGNVAGMEKILEAIQAGASGDEIANLPIPGQLPGCVRQARRGRDVRRRRVLGQGPAQEPARRRGPPRRNSLPTRCTSR